PVTQDSRRKVYYAISDPFLGFWFRFVSGYERRLHSRDDAEQHLREVVLPRLDKFVSEDAFERVCQDWAQRNIEGGAGAGRWWGSIRRSEGGKRRSRRYEADVAVVDGAGSVIALGSCKWPDASTPAHEHRA